MMRKGLWLAAAIFIWLVTMPLPAAEARYYQPSMGRWAQRDPIGYSDSVNLFEYGIPGNSGDTYLNSPSVLASGLASGDEANGPGGSPAATSEPC
jgi:hypothetical protein